MKPDDSSLSASEYAAIHRAATDLLNKANAWDRLPTPVPDLLGAAKLRVAPISAFDPRSLAGGGIAAASRTLARYNRVYRGLAIFDGSTHRPKRALVYVAPRYRALAWRSCFPKAIHQRPEPT